jgi:glycosyltransferase involved in cell wall biosynthesis
MADRRFRKSSAGDSRGGFSAGWRWAPASRTRTTGMDGVLRWLQAGDAFVLISAIEGLPCSLIEAMSAGLPSVVSNIPAHTQLVDNEVNGMVTEQHLRSSTVTRFCLRNVRVRGPHSRILK